ncbi:hypothetical protein ABTZ57_01345 [Streptomyces sp. NPDC094048]|uniref:hypothetical protein n=1 Tax=unclassified Streptomyces TaxID=2593676 RepID=UPI003329DFBC
MPNAIGDLPTDDGPHRNEPDEALRRARAVPTPATRVLLLRIADRLSTANPHLDMREVTRLALALRYATDEHGFDTPATNGAEQALLRLMPQVNDRTISRGEYALLLRAKASRETTKAERVAELHRQAAADYEQNRALSRRGDHRDDADVEAAAGGSNAARSRTT